MGIFYSVISCSSLVHILVQSQNVEGHEGTSGFVQSLEQEARCGRLSSASWKGVITRNLKPHPITADDLVCVE